MTPPLLGVGKENGSNGILLTSTTVIESVGRNSPGLKEHNYLGLSDCSSVDSSTITTGSDECKTVLNLKATELRLGLPGSQSPPRDQDFNLRSSNPPDEKTLFPLHPSSDGHYTSPHKALVLGNKRGFSAAMDGFSQEKYHAHTEDNAMLSPRPNSNLGLKSGSVLDSLGAHTGIAKDVILHNKVQEGSNNTNDDGPNQNVATMTNSSAPATKAQVVGWPPIRSFRKNSLTTATKNSNEVDGKAAAGALFVKVCMDGAPYLRKVDLRNYSAYQELSSALEKMFSCFTIGQYGSHGVLGREMMSESKIKDLLHGSEYVLTYEDKDSDWMLVGDVPWEMFIESCKRLRIMKSADAIGLAPRAVDKCQNRN